MCPPVSPRKGASIVHPRAQCMCFWYGNAAERTCRPARAHPSFIPSAQCMCFWYGNAAARTFGRAHRHRPYHSKHMSPFRKGKNKKFGTCGASAKVKTENLALAELPQRSKCKKWRLRSFRKWQNRKFGACGVSANSKIKKLALAELPQMAKQKI